MERLCSTKSLNQMHLLFLNKLSLHLMSIIFLEHMEEELSHGIQEGGIHIPVFGEFSVIWIVQQKCWEW